MTDPDDLSSRPLLNYRQADEPAKWSMLGLARFIGWCSVGLGTLLFIDPYLPELQPLMFVPICSAAAGLCLVMIAAKKTENRRAALAAAVPNALALLIPTISMFARFTWPNRVH